MWTGNGTNSLTLVNSNAGSILNDARFYWDGDPYGAKITGLDTFNIINGEARFDGVPSNTTSTTSPFVGYDLFVIGANTINLGNGVLQTDSDVFPRLYLVNTESTQTADLNLNGGWLVSDLGGTDDQIIWSGDISITGAATTNIIDVNDAGTADTHIITGAITDGASAGGFSKVNAGTLQLENDNTLTGDVYIQRGGVGLAGVVSEGGVRLTTAAGAFSAVNSLVMSRDGSLYLDNSGTINNNRVNDAAGIQLRSQGRVRLIGNSAGAVSETFGSLLQETGSGKINFDLDDGTPMGMQMTFDSYTRNAGSITQFQVLDDLPGGFGSQLPGPNQGLASLFITNAAAVPTIGSSGANGSSTKSIVVGAFGGVNNFSNHFMTFDDDNPTELRPLTWDGTLVGSEYFLSREQLTTPHQFDRAGLLTNDQNVLINFNTTFDGDIGTGLPGSGSEYGWYGKAPVAILENVAMNSLRFGTNTPSEAANTSNTNEIGSTLVLAPGARLYLGDKAADAQIGAITDSGSGMILFGRDITGSNPGSNQYIAGGILDFGSREAILVNESGNSALFRSNITGTGGLTKAGANNIYLDNSNSYYGDTNIAEGLLDIRDQHALGNSTLVRIEGSGQLYLELGTNVISSADGGAPPDLYVGILDGSRNTLFSNTSNNVWGGNIIVDNVDNLGNMLFDTRIGVNARDNLTINGNIYGNELGSPDNFIDPNPINTDIVLNDARYVTTNGSNSAGGVINLNGQFKDNVNGAIADPVTAANENQLLRFLIQGSNELVVNARQQWDAAGLIDVRQGIFRYEGDGDFWTPIAAANLNAANSQSGMRIGGNINTANAAVILTKPGQSLNIGRIDIGGDGTNNFNSLGNDMIAGTNTTGTVTFGNGTERIVFNGSNSANAFRRDLTAYQAGGGTMELNFRLDDTDVDSLTSFTKIGRGVVNYNGQNGTADGDLEILYMSGGLLRLTNYGSATGRRFDNGAKIVLAGGGIEMDATDAIAAEVAQYTSAAIGSWTGPSEVIETFVSAGGTDVIVTAGAFNTTMNIGATEVNIGTTAAPIIVPVPLNRLKGGTVNFVEFAPGAGAASITLQGTGGQIQADDTAYGWATFGDSYTYNAGTASYTLNALDFAATTGGNGSLGAFAGPTRENNDAVSTWAIGGNDLSEDAAGFDGSMIGAALPVNTIRFSVDAAGSIDATNGLEVSSGGILVNSDVLTGSKSILNGTLNAGIDTDLIVHQYGGADMTIGSVIQDNVGSSPGIGNALVKTGSGNLVLTGTNTYTGGTYLNGGQLTIESNTNLGATPIAPEASNIYANGGTLRVISDVSLDANRGMQLGGNGIEISVGPASTLTYNGLIASEDNLVPGYGANPAVGRIDKTGLGTLELTEINNTYSGLTDVRQGTLLWQPTLTAAVTANPFGSNFSFLDGTTVHTGATLAIHPLTPATTSNFNVIMNEWFTFQGGSTLNISPANSGATPHDFNTYFRGVVQLDGFGNAGTPDGIQTPSTLSGFITITNRDTTYFNDDGGYLTGDGGLIKVGGGYMGFRENSPEWTGQLIVNEGHVDAYSSGFPLGTGTLPLILGHNLAAEQAGEAVSGNGTVTFTFRDEGTYRDVNNLDRDIIVRNDAGAGGQTKRLGARYLANADVVNYNGSLILQDDVQFFYQDDARDSTLAAGTVAAGTRNDTRSNGTLGNVETVYINFNGSIVGAAGNDILLSVAQGGNGNTNNGSIFVPVDTPDPGDPGNPGDDLVIRPVFGLNGDNSGWAGNLTMGNTTNDVDTQNIVSIGNPLGISAQNNVTMRNNATFQTSGNNVVIGSLLDTGSTNDNYIENASTTPGTITVTQTTNGTVDVSLRDGVNFFVLQPGEVDASLSLVKAGPAILGLTKANTFTGTTTLNGGTLRLAYATDDSMLADGAALILNDGILDLAGTVAHTEVVGSTMLNGTVAIERSTGNAIIDLGAITRNAGSLRISEDSIAKTTNPNVGGILGGWATVGSSFATNDAGFIVGLQTFEQGIARHSGAGTHTIANGAGDNVQIYEDGTTISPITMAASGTTTINSLLQSADGSTLDGPNGASVIDIGVGNTLRIASGGILLPDGDFIVSSYSALTFTSTGTLTAGTGAGGTLFLQSQDADPDPLTAQILTVGAVIADDGGMVDVRTSGPGFTVFTGNNTFTGETLVGSGTLAIGDGVTTSGTLGAGKTKVEASSILAFNRPDALGVSGEVYGSGTVAQNGAGVTTLNGATTATNSLNFVAVRGTLATGVDNAINTTGGLTFGESTGATDVGSFAFDGDATTGSLSVRTNSTSVNTMSIAAGKTLTTNGSVTVGIDGLASSDTLLTVTGPGSWVVNQPSGTFQVGGAVTTDMTNDATLDMLGLGSFTADLGSNGVFRVGDSSNSNSGGGNNPSTLTLAGTSAITARVIGVGDEKGSGAGIVTLNLGTTSTVLNADKVAIGDNVLGRRGSGVMQFADTSGTLQIRGSDGTSRAILDVLNSAGGTGYNLTGTVDLSGHSSNLLLNTLAVGLRASGGTASNNNGLGTGVFTFDAGVLDVTTISIGHKTGGAGIGTVSGTVNLGGGTVTVGVGGITMGLNSASNEASTATGTVNLTGGTVSVAGDIVHAGTTGGNRNSSATVNLDGATLDMQGNSIGDATNAVTGVFASGTLQNLGEFNGGAVLDKTTAGTLVFDTANTYTGGTTVSEGTLLVNNTVGSATGSGSVTVALGATLGGSGIISGPTSILGAHNPGNSPGIQNFGSDLTYNGGSSTLIWELIANSAAPGDRGTLFDGLNVGGDLDFAGATAATITFNGPGSSVDWSDALWGSNQEWLVYDVAGTTSNFGNLGLSGSDWADKDGDLFSTVLSTSSFSFTQNGSDVYLNYNIGIIPEPSRVVLLALGVLGIFFRRRRSA